MSWPLVLNVALNDTSHLTCVYTQCLVLWSSWCHFPPLLIPPCSGKDHNFYHLFPLLQQDVHPCSYLCCAIGAVPSQPHTHQSATIFILYIHFILTKVFLQNNTFQDFYIKNRYILSFDWMAIIFFVPKPFLLSLPHSFSHSNLDSKATSKDSMTKIKNK